MSRWYKDKFWFDYIIDNRKRIEKLEKLVKEVCTHKNLIQKDKNSCWLTCDVCGEEFIEKPDGMHNVAPKGSIICKYKCDVNK